MKIKQTYMATSDDIIEIGYGSIEIIADDGRALYTLTLNDEGDLEVSTGGTVKHSGCILDTAICVLA